jgi:hypothetical protein
MSTVAKIVGTLLLVGFMMHYWWITALTISVVMVWRFGPGMWARHCAAVEAEQQRLDELAARADAQHNQVLQGDERGMYGEAWSSVRQMRRRMRPRTH